LFAQPQKNAIGYPRTYEDGYQFSSYLLALSPEVEGLLEKGNKVEMNLRGNFKRAS